MIIDFKFVDGFFEIERVGAETVQINVPGDSAVPKPRYQSPPLRMMAGTEASVSVLLMVVGLPYRPKFAGNGGLNRG